MTEFELAKQQIREQVKAFGITTFLILVWDVLLETKDPKTKKLCDRLHKINLQYAKNR